VPSAETWRLAMPWCPDCRATLGYHDDEDGGMWRCPDCPYTTTTQSLVHRQSGPASVARPYRHYRADGWPYCPRCDEDELWSGETYPTVETIVGCYSCGWKPDPVPFPPSGGTDER
jgi:DNA-directed RNA polymerase subunit M/transcription elongation factor TFIIS